jgi:hypothetical protein
MQSVRLPRSLGCQVLANQSVSMVRLQPAALKLLPGMAVPNLSNVIQYSTSKGQEGKKAAGQAPTNLARMARDRLNWKRIKSLKIRFAQCICRQAPL